MARIGMPRRSASGVVPAVVVVRTSEVVTAMTGRSELWSWASVMFVRRRAGSIGRTPTWPPGRSGRVPRRPRSASSYIAHLELEEGYHSSELALAPEVLDENRFLASRDGTDAHLLDPVAEERVPARVALHRLLDAATPHARELGCTGGLERARLMAHDTGERRQRRLADRHGLRGLMVRLVEQFTDG